jgi:glycosyltransferase involved in cell wall biosynthesis
MRIIQTINHAGSDRGGAERLARGLHEDLLAMGQDARLIALETCDLEGLENAQSLGFKSPRDPRAPLALRGALGRHLRPGDVVHAHLFPTTLYVSVLKQLGQLRTASAMTEHSTWNRRRDRAWGRALDRMIYGGFDQIAAISEQTAAELLKARPECAGRIHVATNGTQLLFDRVPTRATSGAPPLVLSLGRLARPKNYHTALEAMALLKYRPWRYYIAGSGPDEPALRTQVGVLGLEDRVKFLGHVDDIRPLLEASDLFLMPSLWEGFGLAAVEAMNAGLPVIASDVPGLREVVAPTGAPLVSPEDPQALAGAITHLLDDPEQRAKLGARGHEQARRYGRDRMARDYLAMWQDMAAQSKGQ